MLDLLKIVVGERGQPSERRARIEAVAADVGMTLRARGVAVTRIDVPPPLRHPHQSQMETATSLLMTFSAIALVLAAILTAAMLGTILAQHAWQIGVMKTLGAGDSALFGMYLAMTLAIALAATVLALGPAAFAARYLATVVSGLFGIGLSSLDVPWRVAATEVVAGVVLPVAVVWTTLVRSTSVTVREAIDGAQHGPAAFGTTRLEAWLARRSTRSRTLRLAVRNLVRRPGRLVLVVALLGASGAVFVSASAAAAGMRAVVEDGMSHRHYDVEARLSQPESAADVAEALRGVPEVEGVDASVSAAVTSPHEGPIQFTRAYPDGGHGSFAITAVQPATTFLRLPVTRGRWLRDTDTDAVVLNEVALAQQLPGARVGRDIELSVNGRVTRLKLAGVVSDFGNPATAYVTRAGFTRAAGEAGRVTLLRIVTRRHDAAGRAAAVEAVGARLAAEGIALRGVAPVTQFKIILDGHAQALAQTLSAVAVLMALVGILALGSAIGSGVMERTREIGILRSVGASAALVGRMVMTEGLLYGALSWLAALTLAVPITVFLDRFVGTQFPRPG